MKKIFFASVCLASLAMFGCSDPCGDYADEVRDCCSKYPAETQDLCNAVADAAEESGDDDACQAALDSFSCDAS